MNGGLGLFLSRFCTSTCASAFDFLGVHPEKDGFVFRVWAPNAAKVSVVGDFNFWNEDDLPMQKLDGGVWEAHSHFAKAGNCYKYCILGADGRKVYKTDPYARRCAALPDTSGMITEPSEYNWHDGAYRKRRLKSNSLSSPVNIYEVHAGSWKRHEDGGFYTFTELAEELIPYVKEMGYTHIELMPVMEFPYEPSWGYQVTGYFAPTHRYGTPDDLRYFVDACHKENIGVILDWVPAHFPKDESGLYEFDGSCCYEVSDPMMREHPDWGTRIFDYQKPQVKSFLISNAVYWLTEFHVDGLRVDAVASMLYLNYNRTEFRPNPYGGIENLDAIDFLRKLNAAAFAADPAVLMIAEESTAFPMITKPDYDGGLGFLYKWNMGWMNDMLKYMSLDPLWRKGSHNALTFSMTYAYSENFILPLSHDEVVHGKCSLIGKMPGSYEEKFDNLRVFFAYQIAHPGKKMSFMGNEFAQFIEWNFKQGLDWLLLGYEKHQKMQDYVKTLNHLYLAHSELWENDSDWEGFSWIAPDDCDNSVISFRRIDRKGKEILVILNFCPVERRDYRLGVPKNGWYAPLLNSDDVQFGGKGTKISAVHTEKKGAHGQNYSISVTIPAMSAQYYTYSRQNPAKKFNQEEK